MQHQSIPDGSSILPMLNGDLLIQYPDSLVPNLVIKRGQQDVRVAILGEPVDANLADAARRYVQQDHRR